MACIEDLPDELLLMITADLNQYECMILCSISRRFSFLRSRAATRVTFNGSRSDRDKVRKLKVYLGGGKKGGASRRVKPPTEFVFDFARRPWRMTRQMTTLLRELEEIDLAVMPISKVRVIATWRIIQKVLDAFRRGSEIRHLSLTIVYGNASGSEQSELLWELPLWCHYPNIQTLHLGGINSVGKTPMDFYSFNPQSIKELHIGCGHGEKHMLRMHTHLNSLDDEIGSLPLGLQKLTASCREVSYGWLLGVGRRLPELRYLALLNVNICKEGPIYFGKNAKKKKKNYEKCLSKEAMDTDRDPYQHWTLWQRFADEFEHRNLSQNWKRHLIVGGPLVNGNPAIVDDSALQTVTVLSAENTEELRLTVNAAE